MKEIMEIAVNDIKTAFIHILHLIKKVKKNINKKNEGQEEDIKKRTKPIMVWQCKPSEIDVTGALTREDKDEKMWKK